MNLFKFLLTKIKNAFVGECFDFSHHNFERLCHFAWRFDLRKFAPRLHHQLDPNKMDSAVDKLVTPFFLILKYYKAQFFCLSEWSQLIGMSFIFERVPSLLITFDYFSLLTVTLIINPLNQEIEEAFNIPHGISSVWASLLAP